jgi:hypothetical protein
MSLSDFCRFLLCICGWERRGDRGGWGEGRGAREGGIEGGRVTSYDWLGGGGWPVSCHIHTQGAVNC